MGLMDTLRSRSKSHAHSQPGTSPGPPSIPATSASASSSSAATPATPATTTATTVPEHVGIIMDGNGRWARQRGAIASVGHKAGIEALQRTVEGCVELGVKYLSVFALSTENSTNRTAEEVSFLIRLVRSVVNERLGKLHEEGVRLRFIGNLEGIGDSELLEVIRDAEALTAANSTLTLTVALNFSGTDDIVRSTKAIAQRVLDGSISVDDIDAAMISERLSMGYIDAQSRAPDLLIRTGGEQRWVLNSTDVRPRDSLTRATRFARSPGSATSCCGKLPTRSCGSLICIGRTGTSMR